MGGWAGLGGGGFRVDVNEELVFVKIQKKKLGWGGGEGGGEGGREGLGWGGQGGCDRRIEVFGKIHKKKFGWGGGGGGRFGGVRVGEVGVGGGGGHPDVNEELKFL